MTTPKLAFAVYWLSPRGFCNEGWYIWGALDDCRKVVGKYASSVDAFYTRVSKHRSIAAAECRADQEAQREARNRKAWAELNATSAISADEWLAIH